MSLSFIFNSFTYRWNKARRCREKLDGALTTAQDTAVFGLKTAHDAAYKAANVQESSAATAAGAFQIL